MEEDPVEGDDDRTSGARTAVSIAALVTVLAVTGWFVNHRFATAEEASVDACVRQADLAVDSAYSPVDTMLDVVQPQLGDPKKRRSMYALVSRAAEGASQRLEPARAACEDVRVLWLHGGTADRRDDCIARLDRHQEVLAALAEDGAAIEDGLPDLTTAC